MPCNYFLAASVAVPMPPFPCAEPEMQGVNTSSAFAPEAPRETSPGEGRAQAVCMVSGGT